MDKARMTLPAQVIQALKEGACGVLDGALWSLSHEGEKGVRFHVTGLPSGAFDLFEMNGSETLLMVDVSGQGRRVHVVQQLDCVLLDMVWHDGMSESDLYGASATGRMLFCEPEDLGYTVATLLDNKRFVLLGEVSRALCASAAGLCSPKMPEQLLRGMLEYLPVAMKDEFLRNMALAVAMAMGANRDGCAAQVLELRAA